MTEAFRFRFGEFSTRVSFVEELELSGLSDPGQALCVFDRNVYRLHGSGAHGALVIPAGEGGKNWRGVERILRQALRTSLGRDGIFAGIGGGVICDLTAFAASLYMRGCRLILYPTSLLAMVDAALGGKTAVNLQRAKNAIGTFYPAEELRLHIPLLATLPRRELRAGLAEALKTALLGDGELLELLERQKTEVLNGNPALLEQVVFRCLAVKGRIVENDFREGGPRAILNLGHTFGHALESATGFRRISHGEAVAWGLARALDLGVRLGVSSRGLASRLASLLRGYGYALETPPGITAGRLLQAMQADKKRQSGRLRLVLLRRVGEAEVREVEPEAIRATLEARLGEQ
jgi:3-dehydroquinate synthase